MGEIDRTLPHQVISSFLTDVDSVRSNSILTGVIAQSVNAMAAANLKKFLDECATKVQVPNQFMIPVEKLKRWRKLQGEHAQAQRATHITSRAFIVSLVSQYDVFLSALVRCLFDAQPGLIQSSKKTFEVSEILAFATMQEAKEAIADEEIESLLRDSHQEQFSWLERKFDIKTLRKDLRSWPNFVEITQRRNLFVHSDGRISKQYLKVCTENGVKITADLVIGKQLDVDTSYVRMTADTLAEIAVKLTQVLWRKVLPDHMEAADQSLIEITYSLIERKRYQLAIKLLDFGFETIKRFSAIDHKLRMLINRANAYRLLGDKEKCVSLIDQEDWSACDNSFRLAAQILTEKFDAAEKTMRVIGDKSSPSKTDYRDWPLFEEYRNMAFFKDTFKDIFGEDLLMAEVITPDQPEGQGPSLMEFLDMYSSEDSSLNIQAKFG